MNSDVKRLMNPNPTRKRKEERLMRAEKKLDFRYGLLIAWLMALIGYFGPWVKHPSAALAWNAYDLFAIVQLLPAIESGALTVNLQALRLPLIGLGLWLPFIGGFLASRWSWWGAGVGVVLSALTLPPYPQIISAWHTPGWQLPFWWGVGGMLAASITPLFVQREKKGQKWLLLAWTLLTGLPAFLTFLRLIPSLSTLHAARVEPGWGFWLCGVGFFLLAGVIWLKSIEASEVEPWISQKEN